jgi:tRNA 5-methylaminomethyl-2-thiouridine biosynthesis bifunctional protein
VQCNNYISHIEYAKNAWQLFSGNQHIATHQQLILCNAHAVEQLAPWLNLKLKKIRGQTSVVVAEHQLQNIICGAGYIIPSSCGKYTIGATFIPNDASIEIRAHDHHKNLAQLSQYFAAATKLKADELEGHASLRTSTYDYLPLVGPIAQSEIFYQNYAKLRHDKNAYLNIPCIYHPGLFLNLAHGSKGLLTAPYCAELIAHYLCNSPITASEALLRAIHPNRVYLRELVYFKQRLV